MRKFMITVQGVTYEVDVEEVQGGVSAAPIAVAAPAATAPAAPAPSAAPTSAAVPAAAPAPVAVAAGHTVKSPMPGTILGVNVKAGDTVKKGDVLCILEAMKMENEIMAPADSKVVQVVVGKGASVNSGDVLIVLG